MREPDQIDQMGESELRAELRAVLVDMGRMAKDNAVLQSRIDAAVQLADARYREIEKLIAERDGAGFRLDSIARALDSGMTYDAISERLRGQTIDPTDELPAIMVAVRKTMRKVTHDLLDWERLVESRWLQCNKCDWKLEPGAAAKNECPECGGPLNIHSGGAVVEKLEKKS
jgi:hypothetical protein